MNSNRKGKVGERELAWFLRDLGWQARRGQQYCGGEDAPDVISNFGGGERFHLEVKRTERFNVWEAMDQALKDSGGKMACVVARRNRSQWLAVLRLEDLSNLMKLIDPNERR